MKKLIFIFNCLIFLFSIANEKDWQILQEGNKLVFIRHALAPGNGDPKRFDLKECSTQRNLSDIGIKQAKNLGKKFKKNKIPLDRVLSSQWCRCKDTAYHAFGEHQEFPPLNSTYSYPYRENEPQQIKQLKKYVKSWEGKDKNLILVTHFSMITAVTSAIPSSGEIVITDKKFKVLGTIETLEQ